MSAKRNDNPAPHTRAPRSRPNSTDATQGLPLAVRAEVRKDELREVLEKLPASEERIRNDIEIAMASINTLLTGDLENLSDATAAEVNRWLEGSKHLGEMALRKRKSATH